MDSYFSIIKNSLPIFFSSLGLLAMTIIDSVILSSINNELLVIQSLATSIYFVEFICLVSFIMPLANITLLNKNSVKFFKAVLILALILVSILFLINIFICEFIIIYFISTKLLEIFRNYFYIISINLFFGSIFILLRTIATTISFSIKITREMTFILLLNLIINLIIKFLHITNSVTITLIGLSTISMFILFSVMLNLKLPKYVRLQSIIKSHNVNSSTYRKILKTSFSSLLTVFTEHLFFCIIGMFIFRYAHQAPELFRVLLQIDEIFVLFIYSVATTLSIKYSKNTTNLNELSKINSSLLKLVITAIIISIILYFFYPTIAALYSLHYMFDVIDVRIATLFFFSETLLIVILVPLRGLAKYNVIFLLTLFCNWGITFPIIFCLTPLSINWYLVMLIVNNILISVLSCLVKNFKK